MMRLASWLFIAAVVCASSAHALNCNEVITPPSVCHPDSGAGTAYELADPGVTAGTVYCDYIDATCEEQLVPNELPCTPYSCDAYVPATPVRGWRIGGPEPRSCDDICTGPEGGPTGCNGFRTQQVNNLQRMLNVLQLVNRLDDVINFPADSIGAPSPAAPYYEFNGDATVIVYRTNSNPVNIQCGAAAPNRLCCCSSDDSLCPIPTGSIPVPQALNDLGSHDYVSAGLFSELSLRK